MQEFSNPYRTPMPGGSAAPGSSPVKGKMMGPGISLMIVGGLGLLGMGGYFILTLIGLALDPSLTTPPPAADEAERIGFYVGLYGTLGGMAISALLQIFVILGGVNFVRQKGRGMAMAACVLSLIPCLSSCCIFGMPFGIWGLMVLADPNVKHAMQ
jgi:hypothetical protein